MVAIMKNQNALIMFVARNIKFSIRIKIKKYTRNIIGFILYIMQVFLVLLLVPYFLDRIF